MASLKNYFKSSQQKRNRNSSSTSNEGSSTSSPPKKKQEHNTSRESNDSFLKFLDNIDENMELIKEQFENDELMPTWAKLMYAKLCSIDSKHDETQQKMDSLIAGMELFEHRLDSVTKESSDTARNMVTIFSKLHELDNENLRINKKLNEFEDYSKKYNVKIMNLEESQGEDTSELMHKLADIMSEMELNLQNMYIDNIHRLPNNGKGPRPLIVKFVSVLDKKPVLEQDKQAQSHQTPIQRTLL
jgi:chromosome segregation ATPase